MADRLKPETERKGLERKAHSAVIQARGLGAESPTRRDAPKFLRSKFQDPRSKFQGLPPTNYESSNYEYGGGF